MTTSPANLQALDRNWYVVDATDVPLGRLATKVAHVLRGKHRPHFTPFLDTGDFVVVVNAKRVKLTGDKWKQKRWQRHSGTPGGFKETSYGELLEKRPNFIIEKAVKGMLPKGTLGRAMGKKLRVYPTESHPHSAQKPKPLSP